MSVDAVKREVARRVKDVVRTMIQTTPNGPTNAPIGILKMDEAGEDTLWIQMRVVVTASNQPRYYTVRIKEEY